MDGTLEVKAPEGMIKQAGGYLAAAQTMVISSPLEAEQARDFIGGVKDLQDAIRAFYAPHKGAAHSLWKGLVAAETADLKIPEEAERLAKAAMGAWIREEQARARALAQAEQEAARRDAEARALAEAQAAGIDAQAAQEMASMAAETVALTVTTANVAAAPEGISVRKSWKADRETFDLRQLVAFIHGHPEYLNLVTVNWSAVDAMAKAQGAEFRVQGLRSVCVETVASRRA